MRRRRGSAVFVVAALALSSCDPCGATSGCERAPTVTIVGQLLDDASGRPAAGVRVAVRADSGVASGQRETVTNDDGAYQVDIPASDVGTAYLTFEITAPGKPAYIVPRITANATTRAGDATVFRPWVDGKPTLPYVVVLFDAETGAGIGGASLEFLRTGGPDIHSVGVVPAVVHGTTGRDGWIFPFTGLWANVGGTVVGDLVIRLPQNNTPIVIPNATFDVSPEFRPPFAFVTIPLTAP